MDVVNFFYHFLICSHNVYYINYHFNNKQHVLNPYFVSDTKHFTYINS